jgi:FkbM family methyltransferase
MSTFNLGWVQENFSQKEITVFNIGCADLTDDTFRFQMAWPNAQIYSFDCSDYWKEKNIKSSKEFGFNYIHKAVTDTDGFHVFYEGEYVSGNLTDAYAYRGRLRNPQATAGTWYNDNKVWKTGNPVETISLNTFCSQSSLIPDILHIDAEGEEYNILKNLNQLFWPQAIWLEHWETYNDSNNLNVDFSVLDSLLHSRNYRQIFNDGDILYVSQTRLTTPYTPYYMLTDTNGNLSEFEKHIQQKIWLKRYQRVKDPTWPNLNHPAEFFNLPSTIKNECLEIFDLEPLSCIL